mgnify:CR=1 FL=1
MLTSSSGGRLIPTVTSTFAISLFKFLIDLNANEIILEHTGIPLFPEIEHKEYFPFFQFTGYSVEILLDGDIIATIYSHNGKCLPFQSVDFYEFSLNNSTKSCVY